MTPFQLQKQSQDSNSNHDLKRFSIQKFAYFKIATFWINISYPRKESMFNSEIRIQFRIAPFEVYRERIFIELALLQNA